MTVVVGVDGSPPLRTALRPAAQEAHWRQVPLVAVSAYEPPFGLSAGGYPIGALHTGEDERVTVESALRDAVSEELGDHAGQTDLRVFEGASRPRHRRDGPADARPADRAGGLPGKSMLPGRSASTSCTRPSAR